MVSESNFGDVLHKKQSILQDGAMGTELYKRGLFINRCFEEANITQGSLVLDLHKDYLKAGAQLLTTNSWGANPHKLAGYNLQDQIEAINVTSVLLARKAIAESRIQHPVWVIGSLGPLGLRMEPFGPTSKAKAQALFEIQIRALVQGGVDGLSFETFTDLSELQQGILAARNIAPHLPVMAHVSINTEGATILGTPIDWVVQKLVDWHVDAIGLNCSVGPQPMLTCIERVRHLTDKPLSVKPNAGLPKVVDGRQIYMSTPEYLAHFAKEFFQAGVQLVGGCCGTSPEHIKAMAQAFRQINAMQRGEQKTQFTVADPLPVATPLPEASPRLPLKDKSRWSHHLATGQAVYSVELLPPAGVDVKNLIQKAKRLKKAGVHAINIPDGPRASARMSALLTAVMIEQQADMETVLHYTCRDRNLLGMQSDLLGAHAIGLRNLLLITGDPPKMGSYPDATGVFDVDAIGLTHMAHQLNGGIDLGGRPLGVATALSVGVGVNPVHRDVNYEMKRFAWKVDAGAEWVITQPVFDLEPLLRFLDYMHLHQQVIPVVAGIWPLTSYRNALFMHHEVPGVVIPQDVMDKMEKASAKDPEEAKKVGAEIAYQMVQNLAKQVQGIQVSAPFGRIDLALQVLGF
jgi:homocysteine S-methyltransferase